MSELTTPKAVLIGFFLIAISIATLPITSSMLISNASAEVQRSEEDIRKIIESCRITQGFVQYKMVYNQSIYC